MKSIKIQTQLISKQLFIETLNKLIKSKDVYAIKANDKQMHYGKEKGPHFHFICKQCGKVRDFVIEEGAMTMVNTYIQKKVHSFGVAEEINLSVTGRCFECEEE